MDVDVDVDVIVSVDVDVGVDFDGDGDVIDPFVDVDVGVVVDVDVDALTQAQLSSSRDEDPPGFVAGEGLTMLSFQRLDVYQRAVEFFAVVVQVEAAAPKGHATLLDQLRRAAMSIVLNIAEGAGRTGGADAARFFAIARGSAMESAACMDVAKVLGLVEGRGYEDGVGLLERLVAMLTKLCR